MMGLVPLEEETRAASLFLSLSLFSPIVNNNVSKPALTNHLPQQWTSLLSIK